jgi:hypothetical protein
MGSFCQNEERDGGRLDWGTGLGSFRQTVQRENAGGLANDAALGPGHWEKWVRLVFLSARPNTAAAIGGFGTWFVLPLSEWHGEGLDPKCGIGQVMEGKGVTWGRVPGNECKWRHIARYASGISEENCSVRLTGFLL